MSKDDRDNKVRAVLEAAGKPLGPTAIAVAIGEEWCCPGGVYGLSSAIVPVLRRIGATRVGSGQYMLERANVKCDLLMTGCFPW